MFIIRKRDATTPVLYFTFDYNRPWSKDRSQAHVFTDKRIATKQYEYMIGGRFGKGIDLMKDNPNRRQFAAFTALICVNRLVEVRELDSEDRGLQTEYQVEFSAPLLASDSAKVELALDEFHETIPVACLEHFEFRVAEVKQLEQPTPSPQRWVMRHEHEYGETMYPFCFTPTPGHEYPQVELVAAKLLEANFDPTDDESIGLTQLPPDVWPVFGAEVGGTNQHNTDLGPDDEPITAKVTST